MKHIIFLEGCINLEVAFLSHLFSNAFHLGIDEFKDLNSHYCACLAACSLWASAAILGFFVSAKREN